VVGTVTDRREPARAAATIDGPEVAGRRDRAVDGVTVGRGRSDDAADGRRRPDRRGPHPFHRRGVERVVHARLLAVAGKELAVLVEEEVGRGTEVEVDVAAAAE